MAQILVIDDNAALRGMLRFLLEDAGYEVVEAAHGAEGLQQYLAAPPAVVITDLEMPVMDGLQFLRVLRHEAPAATVIAISGNPQALTQAQTLTPHTLAKPFALQHMLTAVQTLVATPAPLPAGPELESDF